MEDKRFTTASATGAGLVGIEVFYNSTNRIPKDELVFKTDDGDSIYLADILKDSTKNKDLMALSVEDFDEDFLPKSTGGTIDKENVNILISFIKREKVMSKPKLIKNGEVVEISTAKLSAQKVFLKIKNTTETIDVRSLLVDASKNKLLEEITADDIKQEYQDNEYLLELIRGDRLEDDDVVHFTYNGKYVAVDNTMYVKQGVATETTLEVGKSDLSSLNREYYTAISTRTDKTPRYIESGQIIPPAYKKVDGAMVFDEEAIERLFAGEQIAVDGVISYRKEDGTLGYRKKQEVAIVDGEIYAVPEGWYANPDNKRLYTPKDEHLKRRVRIGEIKTSNVTGGFAGNVTKKYNVNYDKFDIVIDGVKKTISFYDDHFTIDDDKPNRDKIIFASENYPMPATSDITTFRVKSFSRMYDEATGEFKLDISFVDNVVKNANTGNITGPIDNVANSDEIISSKLVTKDGKVTGIKSVLSREQKNNGAEKTFDLNDVSGINFNVQQKREFSSDCSVFKPAPMFDYKRDENGNIIYKKDQNGNDLLDQNGDKIPEEKEFNADIIQTSKVDEDGNLQAFDFEENDRLVKQFEQEVQILQQELTKLRTSEKNEDNLNRIKDLKQKLDEKLEKIKDIKGKTSIKSVDKLIEDYQNGEFFETFFFENGEMFEIKDGKKIALSSNTSADYNNIMKDLVGNYTVKNNKGKCEVVLGEKAVSMIGGSLKIAETLYTLSFAPSFLSLLAMPLALTVGTGCLAFAGVTATVNLVRNKIKQAQLNRLTPEKIKDKMNSKVKVQTKQDIKQATKDYEKEVKRIKKYTLDETEKEKKLQEVKDKFVAERGKIVGRLSLLDDITIESKYSVKDKKITSANIYGFAEFRKQKRKIKRDKKMDEGAKAAYSEAIKKAKDKRDDKIALLSKGPHYASEKAKIEQAYKVESQDIKNTYLSQNGRLASRLSYLKKTKAYLTADDKTRKQMVEDCKKSIDKDKALKEVVTSTMLTRKNSSRIRSDLYEYVVKHSPDGVPVTPDEEAKILDQEEKLAIQIGDRQLAKAGVTTLAEETYKNVAGFVRAVEKADQVVADKEDKATEQLEAVKETTTGKAKRIKEKQDQAKIKAEHDKEEGQRKKQEKEEENTRNNETLDKENKMLVDTFLKDNQQVKDIIARDELECYATVWGRMNGQDVASSKEEKISAFLNDLAKKNDTDKASMISLIESDSKFKTTYRAILQDKNDMLIGELMAKNVMQEKESLGTFVDDMRDKMKLVAMAKIFVKRAKSNNISLAEPRFKTKDGKPTYTLEEVCNIFLSGLAKRDIADVKLVVANIQKQDEYQKFVTKYTSKDAESDSGVTH